MSEAYKAEVAEMIRLRAEDVRRLGVIRAMVFWAKKAKRGEGPSWQWQERAVFDVLSEADRKKLRRLYPPPMGEVSHAAD